MAITVIICGSRDFDNPDLLFAKCDEILKNQKDVTIITGEQVSTDPRTGHKYGADYWGKMYAFARKLPYKGFPADWKKYKRKAGPMRNGEMAKIGNAVIAFWDGKSTGTKDMIIRAKKQ